MLALGSISLAVALLAKGTLILALGWIAATLLRHSAAHLRHLVWLSVIVGVLLLPVIDRVAPFKLAVLPASASRLHATNVPAALTDVRTAPVIDTRVDRPAASPISQTLPPAHAPRQISFGVLLIALWLIVAAFLALRLIFGAWLVARLLRRARVVQSPDWLHSFDDAARAIGLAASPRLVASDEVDVAFACDALEPTIVLPAGADEWPIERRRAVLLHELAHIRRRDLVGHGVSRFAAAVYWFHPLAWVAARRLRAESEQACDELVLESGVRASDYAQHLLDMVVALDPRHAAPAAALPIVRPREFEGRLLAILERASRRTTVGRVRLGFLVGLVSVTSVSIAAVAPVTRAHRALPDATVNALLTYGTSSVIDPMLMLLRDADSLHLAGWQADSIATLNRAYMIRVSGIWSPVAKYYSSHSGTVDPAIADRYADAPRATTDLLASFSSDVLRLLTPEQLRALPPRTAAYLDRDTLALIAERSSPLGSSLFDPENSYAGGGGRGRRGGAGPGARGRVGGAGQ
jgi:beta-lactamase regulating signal transducer with metallopeptidase domain